MFILVILLVLLTTVALVRSISHDGYGRRPAPRSHRSDVAPAPYYGQRLVP